LREPKSKDISKIVQRLSFDDDGKGFFRVGSNKLRAFRFSRKQHQQEQSKAGRLIVSVVDSSRI